MKIDRTRLFDKRVVQRNIRAGRVTKDEYQAWLAEQSDVGEKIMAREEGGDDDGYEVPIKSHVSLVPSLGFAGLIPSVVSASDDDDDDDDEDDEDDEDEDDDEDDEPEDEAAAESAAVPVSESAAEPEAEPEAEPPPSDEAG